MDGQITAPDVTVGSYLIVPYRWDRGDPTKNEKILSHCATIANLFPLPASEDERKIIVAQTLTDTRNFAWEIWKRSKVAPLELCGIFLMTSVVPRLNGVAHMVFFDRQLVGKRPLIQTMLTWCFEQLELRRISVEIPDHLEPLIRFARKLGFRYEGETLAATHPMVDAITAKGVNKAPQWMAHWGSRREGMHFDGERWRDVILLVLRREDHKK